MHFDFPTIMVLAVFITGAVWALDVWVWASMRRQQFDAIIRGEKAPVENLVKSLKSVKKSKIALGLARIFDKLVQSLNAYRKSAAALALIKFLEKIVVSLKRDDHVRAARELAKALTDRKEKNIALNEQHISAIEELICREPISVEYSRSLFPVILIVLVLRSFLIEPFRIPSGSMMPTLLDGDFILVNKYTYGIRLPVINKKIIDVGQPARGDVAVFRYPRDPSVDYIKRIIGLPGDRVTYRDKHLYINGKLIEKEDFGVYDAKGTGITMAGAEVYEEDLKGVKHNVLIIEDQPTRYTEYTDYVVGKNEYFVMGDNRDNSNDSRFWGTVPEENLVGRAFMIWMNWDSANKSVTWNRIGQSID